MVRLEVFIFGVMGLCFRKTTCSVDFAVPGDICWTMKAFGMRLVPILGANGLGGTLFPVATKPGWTTVSSF